MDLEKAVGLVLAEAKRIGQNEMARRLDVSNGTMSKWKGKTRPQAEQRQRVFAEARRIQAESEAAAEAAAFVVGAVATESHHVEMARISGYVEAVRDMVLQVASRQTDILGMLQPWVAAEARERAHPDAPAVKQAAKAAPVQSRSKAGSPRQGRDPGASSTAPLPAGSDCE